MITLSQSIVKSLLSCEQKAFYGHIKHLEKRKWKKYYVEGNVFQYGIYRLMVNKDIKKSEKEMQKKLAEIKKEIRSNLSVSPTDEREFVEIASAMTGMLKGYSKKYAKDIKIEKHIGNEVNIVYPITKDVQFGCQMDNILAIKDKWYLHEGKAWKYLNDSRLNALASDLQINTYFLLHNAFYKKAKTSQLNKLKPFSGVIFDAVQKPSIRHTNGETYRGYLKRLEAYYSGVGSDEKFFKEVIRNPEIKLDDLLHTIKICAKRFKRLLDGKRPVKAFTECSRYDGCDFYELCFHGETKKNLSMYRQSEYKNRYEEE